jgi:hypothetical protein
MIGVILPFFPSPDRLIGWVLKGLLALARNSIRGRVVGIVFEFGIAVIELT